MIEITRLGVLAPRYDVVFCDVWGVVHNGRAHYARACEALRRFRAAGGTVVLVTNAPRPNPPVREQLARLGVPMDSYDDVVTSGDVTLARIADHDDAPLYHIGPERDLSLFTQLKALRGLSPQLVDIEAADYVVCTGLFDDRNDALEDYDARLKRMRERGLAMISANPDIVVHVGDRLVYCSGALAERYAALGGEVIQAGKPHAPIYEEAMKVVAARRGGAPPRQRILAIGDGPRTDVRGAMDFGLDCLFVAGGIHQDALTRDGGLDPAALERVLRENGVAPQYATRELEW